MRWLYNHYICILQQRVAMNTTTNTSYGIDKLKQIPVPAAALVASKEGIQQCTAVLHKFPLDKYMELREMEISLNKRRLVLKQRQDEHDQRMDRERSMLRDRCAKRRRYNAITDDLIIFRSLLAKALEDSWANQDLCTYHNALPKQPVDTGDLYD